MAAKAALHRITPEVTLPLVRARRPKATVALRFRLADIEDPTYSAADVGNMVRALGLAQAYGSISPAMLAMRTGTDRESAQRLLNQLISNGSLQADQVTGSTL